jgi:predicted unusual protein kinase regulating ubiquinone biosynthesis (AarF/ABC1/UbiB family)
MPALNPLARLSRSARIMRVAAMVYASYKMPELISWTLGRSNGHAPEKAAQTLRHRRNAQLIFDTAIELRGLLIKMCQVIGTRSDIFPPEYVKVLRQCHDRLPPRAFPEIRAQVERELGGPLEQFYDEFESEPLAAASLAQVHRARRRDGRVVAVKVQYPDIEDIVRVDIAGVTRVCRLYQLVDRNPLDLLPLVEELTKHLIQSSAHFSARRTAPTASATCSRTRATSWCPRCSAISRRAASSPWSSSTASRSPTSPGCAPPGSTRPTSCRR